MEAPFIMVGDKNNPMGSGQHHMAVFTLGDHLFKGIHRILDDHNAQRGLLLGPGYGAAVINSRFIAGNPYGHIDERFPFNGFLEIGPETIILIDETFGRIPIG